VLYCISQFGLQCHVYIDYVFAHTLTHNLLLLLTVMNIVITSFRVFLAFLAKMNILIFVSHMLTPLLAELNTVLVSASHLERR